MKKTLYLSLAVALTLFLCTFAFARLVPPGAGDCRAPEACYECHGGHILIAHDCNTCHDYQNHPFPVGPEIEGCLGCHRHPPTETPRVNIVCQDCHDPVGDPPFVHPSISFRDPPGPPEDCELCTDCHVYDHPGPENKAIDCEGCHAADAPNVDPQCKTCHTGKENKKKYDLGCDRGALSVTGLMTTGRFVIETETLEDGRFLITGGLAPPFFSPVNTAEILDPKTRIFTPTSNSMSVARTSHTLTPLQDGRIIIIGGRSTNASGIPLDTAEIYDPVTDTFTPTAGTLNIPRRSHRAILLDDGRVLVTGGGDSSSTGLTMAMDSIEIYDPVNDTFELATETMSDVRQFHNMEKMSDGKVLIIGGGQGPGLSNPAQSVDIFNPADNSITPAGDMISKRMTVGVSQIKGDKVLLAFAWDGGDVTNASEVLAYDAASSTVSFTPTAEKPVHGKVDIFAVTLLDGTVLLPLGGNEQLDVLPDTTLYRPNKDDFVLAGATQYPNTGGNSDLLKDGRAVLAGGFSIKGIVDVAEIYTPDVVAQAKGLKKLIGDIPKDAFDKKEHKSKLKEKVQAVKDKLKDEKYQKAKDKLDNKVIVRIDGCSGGDPSDDWIVDCDAQDDVFAVADLLAASLDQILGNSLPPVVTASVDIDVGVYPHTVNFTGTAVDPDGTVDVLFWDFDDTGRSTDLNPTHTYFCPGDYTAVLTAIDNDGLVSQAGVAVHVEYPEGVKASFNCDLLRTFGPFCGWCHFNPAFGSPLADLNLTSYDGVMAGAYGGTVPVVIPGDPFASSIFTRTGPAPCGDLHPTALGGERLQEHVREKLKIWIEEGAVNN